MWYTVGFGISCVCCVHWLWRVNCIPLLLLLLLCAGILHFAGRIHRPLSIFAIICLGFTGALLWFTLFRSYYIHPILPLDGTELPLRVTALSYSEQTKYSNAFDGIVKIEGKPYKVRVYYSSDAAIQPEDTLEGNFRLRVSTPEGIRESSYDRGNGTYLIASQRGEATQSSPENRTLLSLPPRLAQIAKENLASVFQDDDLAFAKALLLGDTDDLSYETDTALKVSGIRHIAAVSGLHVSIIFAAIVFLLHGNRIFTPLVAIPTLFLFALVTGFTPSVTRACLMTAVMLIGSSILEEYDGLTSLAFACLFMLHTNPYAVDSVSLQLSVASVAGILLFATPIHHWINTQAPSFKPHSIPRKLLNWFSSSVSVSTSAQIFTIPLSAYYFGTVSLIGVLTNLLTLWLISILFFGIASIGILYRLIPWLFRIVGFFLTSLIRIVLSIASLLSQFPFASVYTQSPFIVFWLVLCYLLLAFFFLLHRKHGKWLALTGIITLLLSISASILLPKMDDVRLNVLDVGEGQCILLQSQGHNLLIDCGGDDDAITANTAAQTLLSQGIRRLDGVILTHYDRDHSGALNNLLTRIQVDTLIFPKMEDNSFLDQTSSGTNSSFILISELTRFPFGCGTITLSEPGNWKTNNENCMCVLFESEKCAILITGDRSRVGEKRLLNELEIPDLDILIGGHHGSKSATSEELLDATQPEIVIFSVGKNNNYGHPAQDVLERLESRNCQILRTDLQGSILIRR